MQEFCSCASLILTGLGILAGLAGYYMDAVCYDALERQLWTAITLILAITGLVTGKLIQRLNLSSHTDFLTGLWNRRYLFLRLEEEMACAARKKKPLCVAMIDADDFKTMNDTYGHSVGDVILSYLAAIFKRNTRANDIVTRWGGDEFAIVFPETSLTDACEVMERIRGKVEAEIGASYGLTISAGIIPLQHDQDVKRLLMKADQALYKAKERKNSVIILTGM